MIPVQLVKILMLNTDSCPRRLEHAHPPLTPHRKCFRDRHVYPTKEQKRKCDTQQNYYRVLAPRNRVRGGLLCRSLSHDRSSLWTSQEQLIGCGHTHPIFLFQFALFDEHRLDLFKKSLILEEEWSPKYFSGHLLLEYVQGSCPSYCIQGLAQG